MTLLQSVLTWNTLIASGLAVLAGLMGQTVWLRRRPAVMHALWLLVLAKFITPAFIPLPVLPMQPSIPAVADSSPTPSVTPTFSAPENLIEQAVLRGEASASQVPVEPSALSRDGREMVGTAPVRWQWTLWMAGISILVSAWILLRSIVWMVRFHRWLRLSSVTNERLSGLLATCRERMGARHAPAVRVLHGRYSPFLWAGGWQACIYIPESMIDEFTDEQISGILCHELAHHLRRDTWANLFAFGVVTLYWWNPLAWMARRALSEVQELCCDALVLARLGLSRKVYAETLYTTLDFIDRTLPVPSALSSGWGGVSSLKARFRMIGDSNVAPRASRGYLLAMSLLAGMLLCFPVHGQPPSQPNAGLAGQTEQRPSQQESRDAVPQPSKQSVRAETLQTNIADFTLMLDYSGEEDKPYHRLFLSVPPVDRTEIDPSFRLVQIDENRARKIIDYLATEGFLQTAQPIQMRADPNGAPVARGYELSVSGRFHGRLGWDMAMLKRLQSLRNILDGEAAKSMDLLLDRLDGHHQEWEQTKTHPKPPRWGEAQNGLRSRLFAEKQVFLAGESVPLKLELENVSDQAVNYQTPAAPHNHMLQVVDERGREAPTAKEDIKQALVGEQAGQVQQRAVNPFGVQQVHPSMLQSQNWLDIKARLATSGMKYRLVAINEKGSCRLSLAATPTSDLTPLKGLQLDSLDISNTPVEDLTPLEGMPLRNLDLSGTQVKSLMPLKGMKLTVLSLWNTRVSDLSPLTDAKLTNLSANSTPLADLSPLAAMPLNYLDIRRTAVKDLMPVAGTPLETLQIEGCAITDLSPLRKTPLVTLRLSWTEGLDLSQLQGMTLKNLNLNGKEIGDLSSLRGMQLESLGIIDTSVKDVSPLQGLPLRSLTFNGSPITDLTPLTGMKLVDLNLSDVATDLAPLAGMPLETISIPTVSKVANIEVLRDIKTLKWIRPPNCKPLPTADFWRGIDAGAFSKPEQPNGN